MRLLALVPAVDDTSPGQRFRFEQWEPWFRRAGIESDYVPFECQELHDCIYRKGQTSRKIGLTLRAWARRMKVLRSVREYDLVYVFREAALLGPPIFERQVRRSGVPMVFDFDDAIFVHYWSLYNGVFSLLKFPGKTDAICRMSTHVMAGNAYLADYARQRNPNVTIVPTTIDTDKYTIDPGRPEPDLPVIGWSGSHSTVRYFDTIAEALKILATRERFRLRVIGTPQYKLEGVDVEALPWRSETEVEDLRPMDIGVMPLPDDAWARGKCGLKALQYMALGIPTICSPVGVNTEIIRDGENGLLASTAEEWVEKLTSLLRSRELRHRLGLAGRATVESEYSAAVQAPRVCEIFESAVSAHGRPRGGGAANAVDAAGGSKSQG